MIRRNWKPLLIGWLLGAGTILAIPAAVAFVVWWIINFYTCYLYTAGAHCWIW